MKKILLIAILFVSLKSISQCTYVGQLPYHDVGFGAFSFLNFFDQNNGYTAHVNKLFKTTDGGETWNLAYTFPATFPAFQPHHVAYGADFNHAFFNPHYGSAYKTTDGGTTFEEILLFGDEIPKGMFYFRDNLRGYFISTISIERNNYWRTTDGGESWNRVSHDLFYRGINYLDFPVAESSSGMLHAEDELFKSVDDGLSWNSIGTINYPNNEPGVSPPQFFDLQNGVQVRRNDIIKTVDGGLNWTAVGNRGGQKIIFKNPSEGYLLSDYRYNDVASTTLYRTTDGGISWNAMTGIQEYEDQERIYAVSIPKTSHFGYAITSKGRLYKFNTTPLSTSNNDIKKVTVYPNPTKDFLFISGDGFEAKPFTIYDVTGRKVIDSKINSNKIDTRNLSSGYYFLKIDDFQTTKFKKD